MRRYGRLLLAISIARASVGLAVLLVLNPKSQTSVIACISLLALAQLSDVLDGWLARRYSAPSIAGYLEDSVADKLLHFGCLLGLSQYYDWVGLLIWFVCLREVSILAIRIVTPNLSAALDENKWLSITYAVLLRGSILAFFLAPLVRWEMLVSAAYALLGCAAVAGCANVTLLLTATGRSARQPTSPERGEQH
ncbi:MAG: CDP-alcohol phosphatidyltransferase family protein [Bdellovibrionales bacterium]|nr:CDP-alcohol phosphatidyltransferase family protein [Bdellovibrionales bacterium]